MDSPRLILEPFAAAPEQCVILVGDLSLAPVGGRPLLHGLLWHARRFGFRRALLLAPEPLDDILPGLIGDGGLEIAASVAPAALGTAGALRHAAGQLDETFLLLDGQRLFDVNWLALAPLMTPGIQAATALRADGESGGVFLLSRGAVVRGPVTGSLGRDLLPALAAAGGLRAATLAGEFVDLRAPDGLATAQARLSASLSRPAVFFDRDGVVIHDGGYLFRVEDVAWIDGAAEAIRQVNDLNLFAFLVTNQGGVGLGLYGREDVEVLHAHLQAELRRRGAHLDDIRYCPHHPKAITPALAAPCDWRKPGSGMLRDLAARWPVDLGRSLMIGDRDSDVAAGEGAGVRSALFPGGNLATFLADQLDR